MDYSAIRRTICDTWPHVICCIGWALPVSQLAVTSAGWACRAMRFVVWMHCAFLRVPMLLALPPAILRVMKAMIELSELG